MESEGERAFVGFRGPLFRHIEADNCILFGFFCRIVRMQIKKSGCHGRYPNYVNRRDKDTPWTG